MSAPPVADRSATGRPTPLGTVGVPPVDVIVLGWKNGDKTLAALHSVQTCGYPDLRVIVVENGSDDGSDELVWAGMRELWPDAIRFEQRDDVVAPDVLEAAYDAARGAPMAEPAAAPHPRAVFVRSLRNRGYSGGMNLGLQVARIHPGRYFFFIANDIVVVAGAIEALVARCAEDDRIGLCGATHHELAEGGRRPRTIPGGFSYAPALGWNFPVRFRGTDRAARDRVERKMNAIKGSAVFGSYWFLEHVGLLSTDRFVYFEEPEWALRARRAGFRLAWAPQAVVRNQHGNTIMVHGRRRSDRLAMVHYLMARGGVRFTVRHYPYLLPTVVAARLVRTAEDALRKGPRVGWYSLLGVWDGLRGRHRRFELLGSALLPGCPDGRAGRPAR